MIEVEVEDFANRAYVADKATEVAVMINNLIEMHREQYSFQEWATGCASALAVNAHNKIVRGLESKAKEGET